MTNGLRRPMSVTLENLTAKVAPDAMLSFGEVVKTLGEQAFGMLIVIFALPAALPVSALPGISLIFGLPVVFVALHLVAGRKRLWLPLRLGNQTVEASKLSAVTQKAKPLLMRVERLLKPRWPVMTSWWMERILGVILLGISLLLLLPIPFSNMPLSGLIILFGLGFSERDGVVLLSAAIGSVVYVLFLVLVFEGAGKLLG